MHIPRPLILLTLLVLTITTTAQDLPAQQTITRHADDNTSLVADFYPASDEAPVVLLLLLHMLNSSRSAYQPLIPDLRDAGYTLLNIDMRGHGDSGGARHWDATSADIQDWADWLHAEGHINEGGMVIIGGSIGANVALISCAETVLCRGAVALSPGLDYRGVQPESALVDGLSQRTALLVASHADSYSAQSIRMMFLNAKGDVTARLYPGRAHGTRLFDSDYESVSALILGWLDETFASVTD